MNWYERWNCTRFNWFVCVCVLTLFSCSGIRTLPLVWLQRVTSIHTPKLSNGTFIVYIILMNYYCWDLVRYLCWNFDDSCIQNLFHGYLMNAEKIAFQRKLPPIRYSLVVIHKVLKNYNPVNFLFLQTFSSFLKRIFKF